jgi:phage baseplate assembly protein W
MKTFRHPFSIDVQGHVATTDNYAEIVRGQLVDVLMTNHNERAMRARYGSNLQAALFDPSDDLVRSDAARMVMESIQQFAPRVIIVSIQFSLDPSKPGIVWADVVFRSSAFDEARALRIPVLNFLSEETPV